MTPYHHTFHPVRRVDGRMVVADENEWRRLYSLEMLAAESNEPCRVLIGPEVFGEYTSTDMLRTANGEWARWDTSKWKQYAVSGHAYLNCADVRNRLFRLIDVCPHVTFCIETDRPDDIYRKLPAEWRKGGSTTEIVLPPNFWYGCPATDLVA